MKWAIGVLLVVMLGAAALLLFTGPRMREQPHVRAYQARMPTLPAGVVPVEPRPGLPAAAEADALTNALSATAANLARGQVYYGYYCAFCHGPAGAGDGPVGQSYTPVPADLRSPAIGSYTEGKFLRAMLTGTGHAPVLERVVPPEHRWYLVLYAHSLSARQPAPAAPPTKP